MTAIIIMGSARVDGHSHLIANQIQQHYACDRVDLQSLNIGPFTYTHANKGDDFIPLIKKLLDYDLYIFLTPVYWYSMSGVMKTFMDRLTDCLQIEKELGRQLRGKSMLCVACGSEPDIVEGYFVPFEKTADYLGMTYQGSLHTWVTTQPVSAKVVSKINTFFQALTSHKKPL